MTMLRFAARRLLSAALVTMGGGAASLACEANVETLCFGGVCPEATGGTGTTSGTGGTGGGSGGSGGGDGCSSDPQKGDLPCEVQTVLEAKCHTCHNAEHLNGAPIDLLTCDRFHETDCGSTVRFRTARSYVESGFMPLGANKLTPAEKTILLDWFAACSPCDAAGMGCTEPPGTKACYE